MNKILALISVFGLAFLVGCGDDDSSSSSSGGTYSCNMEMSFMGSSSHTCTEMAASSVTDAMKASCASLPDLGVTATLGTACPSGSVISCETTLEGIASTNYYYDEAYKGMSCDSILAQENAD